MIRQRERYGLLMINWETARLICSDSSLPLCIFIPLILEQGRTPVTWRPFLEKEKEEGQRVTSLLLQFFCFFQA